MINLKFFYLYMDLKILTNKSKKLVCEFGDVLLSIQKLTTSTSSIKK